MKKNIFIIAVLMSFLTQAQTFTLSGKIVDENNVPLQEASVYIPKLNKGTTSAASGAYEFMVSPGIYTVEVRYLGFITQRKDIQIRQQNEVLNFSLKANENVLDEVLVAAVRANSDIPVTFSNLSKTEIAKRNLGQDIPVLLHYLPSVISSSDAGAGIGYTYLTVRGSNSERINVTINGIPYNDAESHGTFWVNLSDFASSTENLQLQRGVGTSTNGSGAFGASLNILTDAVRDDAYGEISNSFGSFGTRKHTLKFGTGNIAENTTGKFELSGRLSNIYSDGYVDRAFADLKSYFFQAAYTDKNTLIKALAFGGKERTYQAWFGLTADELQQNRRQNPYTYENEVDDYQQDHYQLHWNQKLNPNWSFNLGLNYTQGAGFFEQYKAGEDVSLFGGIVEDTNGNGTTDAIVRRWLDNDFYVVNINTEYTSETINITSGVSYSNYTGDHFGEVIWARQFASSASIQDRYYFSDAQKTDVSLFTKTTFGISDQLSAYLDLQGRFVQYETTGTTSDIVPIAVQSSFNFFNPKAGLTYTIAPQNRLYISYARANREPNRNDFENGVTTAEGLHDFELGWRYKTPTVELNTNIYYMKYNNQLVLTGAIDDVGAPIRATSGESKRVGLEIDATIALSSKLRIQPNIALSRNTNTNFKATIDGVVQNLGNTPLSFSPNTIVGNTISYAASDAFQIAFLSKYVGKQWMSNLNSTVSNTDMLEAYFTSDLNFAYTLRPKKLFDAVVFRGLINNVFNAEFVDRGYYYTYDDTWSSPGNTTTLDGAGYYPQATINFLLGVTLRF